MKVIITHKDGSRYGPFNEEDIYPMTFGKLKRYSLRQGLNLLLICEGSEEDLKVEVING